MEKRFVLSLVIVPLLVIATWASDPFLLLRDSPESTETSRVNGSTTTGTMNEPDYGKENNFYDTTEEGKMDYWVIVDEHDKPLPADGWYYNCTGGDRGMLNAGDINYSWDDSSVYTATVVKSQGLWTWGGMWYSLIRINRDNIPLDFKAIFSPYVKSEYQGEITAVEIVVSNVSSQSNNKNLELKLELKDESDTVIFGSKTWTDVISGPYPKTYIWTLPENCKKEVKLIFWTIDKAQPGDSVSVDKVRLKARVHDLATIPTEEQAFLWTYSWLMANYNPNTGIVQDRSNFGSGDFENIVATAKAAKTVYYAYKKGYTTPVHAETIIAKIANTLINVVPKGPPGKNTLWPHFTFNGGTQIKPGTEWASCDTVFAALDIITTLQMLGDPQGQIPPLENFLREIDWEALLLDDGGISHGYSYEGDLLPYSWKGFGMETIGINWAYASATGNVGVMETPPSDNGSGFIDNAQYPMVFSGRDRWGNDWDNYRNNMADTQIGWYCATEHNNAHFCNAGLFGLSAAENPEADSYTAYGVGGKYTAPENGNDDVIVLHYSGMIGDIRPENAKHVWELLRDGDAEFLQDRVVISPLNNMESMRVDKNSGKCTVNHLKGSWNLALQAEGWALMDSDIRNDLMAAIKNNIFLYRGYILLKTGPPTEIEFTYVPPFGSHNDLVGRVLDVNPDDYKVAVYICVPPYGWWTKPYSSQPLTSIASDGTWTCDITTGGSDFCATKIVAFLVSNGYDPPIGSGQQCLASELYQYPYAEATRYKKISFSGYDWWVKRHCDPVGPGPNYFSDSNENVWLDSNGYLHMRIVQIEGKWYCSEVIADVSLGYGTYVFTVKGRVDLLDQNIVLGLFTWEDCVPQYNYREIDIELSRWGNPANDNAQFVVQPWDLPGNRFRFDIDLSGHPNETTTHEFTWQQNRIDFQSYHGDFSSNPLAEDIIASWYYTGGDIPPAGGENPRINLWLLPPNGQDAEIVVRSFRYLPIGGTEYHPADNDSDYIIGDFELLDSIDLWAQGQVGDFELLDTIDLWAAGHYYWDEDEQRFKPGEKP